MQPSLQCRKIIHIKKKHSINKQTMTKFVCQQLWKSLLTRLTFFWKTTIICFMFRQYYSLQYNYLESEPQCIAYILARWPRNVRLVRICIRPIGSMLPVAVTRLVSHAAFRASCGTERMQWVNVGHVEDKMKEQFNDRNKKEESKKIIRICEGKNIFLIKKVPH